MGKTVEDYMEELERLEAAGELDDEPEFHGTVLNLPQWEKYQRIAKPLAALQDKCEAFLNVRYYREPYPAEEYANVTVTLPLTSRVDGEAKNTIADAVQLCDQFFASAIGGKVRLSFIVDHIWAE
jgi:hypothetical protein